MAKAKYDGPINKHTDFTEAGPNGEPASGLAVQNYIKEIDSRKVGIGYTLPDGTAHLFFADEEDRDAYIEDPTQTELIIDRVALEPLYTMNVTLLSDSFVPVFVGSTGNYIRFTFETQDKSGGIVSEDVSVKYTITRGTTKQSITQVYHAGTTVAFNVDKYISEGSNNISIAVTGITTGISIVTGVIYQVINLTLEDSFNIAIVYDTNANPGASAAITYTVTGNGYKVMEWYVDGVQLAYSRDDDEITSSPVTQTKFIPLAGLSQGIHSIQFRCGIQISGEIFYTPTHYVEVIVSTGNTLGNPVVAVATELPSGTVLDENDSLEISATQYESTELRVAAWDPSGTYQNTVSATSGALLVGSVVCLVGSEALLPLNFSSDGTATLTLSVGNSSRTIGIDVEQTSMSIRENTTNLEFNFEAAGRTNDSVNKDSWTDGTHTATFNNFSWNSVSGWSNGKLLIPSGASVSFDYAPLSGDPCSYGKTIELDFKTLDVEDENAVLLNLVDNSGAGIKLSASKIQVTSQNGVDVSRRFKTEEDMRVSIVINKRSDTANQKLLFVYFNGILSIAAPYAGTDSFSSSSTLSIGGTGSGILLRQVRIYNSALSSNGVVNNFILYQDTVAGMVAAYERNELYEEGTNKFDLNKIASYLPVMVITGNIPAIEATTDKKLQIVANIQYTNLQDPTRNFTMENAIITGQGTSSMTYPKKNLRIYTRKSDDTILYDASGNVVSNRLYSFKSGAQPVDCWCLKTDFAESSGTHNTGVAKLWNDTIKKVRIGGQYVLRTEAQKTAAAEGYQYDVRTTIDGFPIVVFYHLTEADDLIFLGKYNFNNDKSTESVFGFTGIPEFNDSNVQCFEFLDSGNELALFHTVTGFDDNWDKAWESRYPDTKTPNLTNLKSLATWLVDTYGAAEVDDDPTSPTYNQVIVSDQTKFNKWQTEKANHFDLYKLAAYYVYLMRFGAVDQTVKNAMLMTEDGQHWFFILYDNDTIFGVRNDGLLRYSPRINRQTPDPEIGGYAYAGHSATIWNNFEADPECMTLAAQIDSALYTAGLTYENMINMFNNSQAGKWAEAIYNQDAQYKYIGPYLSKNLNYLGSLQGSRSDHRKWWISNRMSLYDAMFVNGAYEGNAITLLIPGAQTGTTFSIVSGQDFYYGYGENNLVLSSGIHVAEGDSHTFALTKNMEIGSPLRIYAPYCIETLNLSNFITYIGATNFNLAAANNPELGTKMKNLILGVNNPSIDLRQNVALADLSSVANLTALEVLNIAGYKAITTLDLTHNKRLTTLKAGNSGLSSVSFAQGSPLTLVELPSGIHSLTLDSHVNLLPAGLVFEDDGVDINSLTIKNCPALVASPDFVLNWFENKSTPDENCTLDLEGVNWANADIEDIMKFVEFKENGGTLILRGKCTVPEIDSLEDANRLIAAFGENVFDPSSAFYVEAPAALFISGPTEVLEGQTAQYSAVIIGGSTEGQKMWSLSGTARQGASINSSTGVLTTTENGVATSSHTINLAYSPDGSTIVSKSLPIQIIKRVYPTQAQVYLVGDSSVAPGESATVNVEFTVEGINGDFTSQWTLTGDLASYAEITSYTGTQCVVTLNAVPETMAVTGTVTCVLKKTVAGTTIGTYTKTVGYKDPTVAFTSADNQYAMEVLYNAGLCANANYITKLEAAAITESQLQTGTSYSTSKFYANSNFRNSTQPFDGFKWFTGLQSVPTYLFYYCRFTSITLPEQIISIGDSAFNSCSYLSSITIPDSVTTIGNSAFSSCSGLTSIILSNSLTVINENVFWGCNGITSINIPDSVTTIKSGAFGYCNGLSSVFIPHSVTTIDGRNPFNSCPNIVSITVDSRNANYNDGNGSNCIYKISDNTLVSGCKNTIIPNTTVIVGGNAFDGCSGLASLTIPNTVTTLNERAFNGCSGLTSITIPDSVVTIGFYALGNCVNLEYLRVGSGISTFGSNCFENCGKSKNNFTVDWYSNATSTPSGYNSGSSVFYGTKIQTINFYGKVPSYVCGCYWNGSTNYGASVVTANIYCDGKIGACAFVNNHELLSVNFQQTSNITEFEPRAFSGCYFTSFTIPNSITKIGERAFYNCAHLISISIPNSVTRIGSEAFRFCSALTSISIPEPFDSSTYNSSGIFANCTSLTSVEVPSLDYSTLLFGSCSEITSVVFRGNVPNYALYTSNSSSPFYNCSKVRDVTIEEGCVIICQDAFRNCTWLTNITIPSTVTAINTNVFTGCTGLVSITCGASTPPTIQTTTLPGTSYVQHIYVPAASVEAYKAASNWSTYASVIEAIPSN